MGKLNESFIDATIVAEYYVTGNRAFEEAPVHPSLATLTLCVLVLKNGFTVVGESNCIDAGDFDAELGRKIARASAVNKVFQLEAYAWRERQAAQRA